FGPALKLPWTRLEAPELTLKLRNRMIDGCNEMAGERSFKQMVAKRDQQIVAVLRALRDTT
ncbi:MAG: 3-hydroxybutyryl-CoA dehydrogenase, partial [Paracoccaceae bacterium]|nr:3-hydroxybutyryl-CoA dehydrogenase [Paracoccaceae bacterium]